VSGRTDDEKKTSPARPAPTDRRARLDAQLKANIARRKAAQRAPKTTADRPDTEES
jgi:hypothetical protein